MTNFARGTITNPRAHFNLKKIPLSRNLFECVTILSIMNPQDTAREQAIAELGIIDLPREMQDDILSRVGENVMQRVALAALDRLSPADQDEFATIAERGDITETQTFLRAHIPELETLMATETRAVIEELKHMAAGE